MEDINIYIDRADTDLVEIFIRLSDFSSEYELTPTVMEIPNYLCRKLLDHPHLPIGCLPNRDWSVAGEYCLYGVVLRYGKYVEGDTSTEVECFIETVCDGFCIRRYPCKVNIVEG